MIWLMFLVVGMYILKSCVRLVVVVLLFVFCLVVMMSLLYEFGVDLSCVYYGIDICLFEFFIGCVLVLVWFMKRLFFNRLLSKLKYILYVIEFLVFCILVLCVYFIDEYEFFFYRGGMFLISMVVVIFIVCVCYLSSFLGNLFLWRLFCWFGIRFYGIYFWYYFVIVLSMFV